MQLSSAPHILPSPASIYTLGFPKTVLSLCCFLTLECCPPLLCLLNSPWSLWSLYVFNILCKGQPIFRLEFFVSSLVYSNSWFLTGDTNCFVVDEWQPSTLDIKMSSPWRQKFCLNSPVTVIEPYVPPSKHVLTVLWMDVKEKKKKEGGRETEREKGQGVRSRERENKRDYLIWWLL